DLGSQGPAGDVLEGVYTFPEHRGRGYATSLVAGAMAANDTPASLHVAAHNAPARRAYEAAGMREAGTCRLLLLG
ncbi:MAG: GNAT family N-acetyltransferase, partial [Planctomycetota bacterium]|nr:GNAT family N-acetyltransferase [Planctomycetota bacterium]